MLTGFFWLRTNSSVGVVWMWYWTFRRHKRRRISRPAEQLAAFQWRLLHRCSFYIYCYNGFMGYVWYWWIFIIENKQYKHQLKANCKPNWKFCSVWGRRSNERVVLMTTSFSHSKQRWGYIPLTRLYAAHINPCCENHSLSQGKLGEYRTRVWPLLCPIGSTQYILQLSGAGCLNSGNFSPLGFTNVLFIALYLSDKCTVHSDILVWSISLELEHRR
jgi:hypothetical protein